MTTQFKSPHAGTPVMALSALGAAPGSTGEFTNEVAGPAPSSLSFLRSSPTRGFTSALILEEAQMLFTQKKRSLAELTRHLVSHPSDEAALSAVCVAIRDGGQIEEVVALLELGSNPEQADSLPDHAMAELCFRIAKECTGANARELCRTALNLCPVHLAALSLFEELAYASWTDELCARYQIFLEDAPAHGVSPDICEVVMNKLLAAERASSCSVAEATRRHQDLDNDHHQGFDAPKRAFITPSAHGLQPMEPQMPAELGEPREARPSGALRVAAYDADVPGPDDLTLRLGFRISRPNAPVPVWPSMLVDSAYLQAVSSVANRTRARRRSLALAAACSFLCGALALPLTSELVRRMTAPVTASVTAPATATSALTNVGASLRTPPMPRSASPDSEPPHHRTRMDLRDAAAHVHSAQELRSAGRVRDARRLLIDVLDDRSGYPPALAAMAELELEGGQAVAAVRWARFAVRALPGSAENWALLSRACTAAGLHAESTRAQARALLLSL